jgi:signal transduction histidine kinase
MRRVGGRSRTFLIALLIGIAVLAPLALFGSLVRDTVDRDVVARSGEERLVAARIAAASIDRELRSAGSELVLFGAGPTLRAALRQRDGGVLDRSLAELLRGRANSLGAILDPNGIVLAAPLARNLVGQDFSRRDYFQGALRSTEPYVSEIFASASAGNPSVVGVSYAVREEAVTTGVLVLTLAPADFLELLQPLRQVEGRDLLIVDPAGRVVASTDPGSRPLSASAMPAAAPSGDEVQVAGRRRIVTGGDIAQARWTLYVLDDPSVVLMGQRRLSDQLRTGAAVIAGIGLFGAATLALLFARTMRQRDELRASRAALAETNLALEGASRHKSDFLASMSHELRTPLNAVLGFSELLREQLGAVLSERQRRYLGNIHDAGDHLLGLINDVLDLSKVEAGRMDLRPELTTLDAVVAPVVSSTRAAADARGVAFSAEVPEGTALVIDAARVRQILYNLLSNAVKFTPVGGAVRLRAVTAGRDVRIEVSDSGIGIPVDKLDRVFGTFERLHEGRSDAAGTGLGLALTKRLVELLRGTISFESRENAGTTFRVVLPDVVPDVSARERLLVVEDEPRDADLIVALAANAGLASEVVRSVSEALAAIARVVPIAMVLDIRLPDGRGEALLEALKADPATRDVPVVVVTVEDDEGRSRGLGADDHVTKPIDHARLGGWLRQVAARARGTEVPLARAAGG